MSIIWRPAPSVFGNFTDCLYTFFKEEEAADDTKRYNPHMVLGNMTMGVGFDFVAGGKVVRVEVLKGLGLKYDEYVDAQEGTTGYIERSYIQQLQAAKLSGNISEVNRIMKNRYEDSRLDSIIPQSERRPEFRFYSDAEVKAVYLELWETVYSKRIDNALPVIRMDPAFYQSMELIALASRTWNASINKDLKEAILNGNRE